MTEPKKARTKRALPSTKGKMLTDFPEIAAQWDEELNGLFRPSDVPATSREKFWWVCKVDNKHKWDATVAARTRTASPTGCPVCAGKKTSTENSLANCFPEIAKQWNHQKNGAITPDQVSRSSGKKFWWVCTKDPRHTWESTVYNRTLANQGCGICSGKIVCEYNSLEGCYPAIAREWHPTKNDGALPASVHATSPRRAWWKCPVGSDHEWPARVVDRTKKNHGCTVCSGRKAVESSSLLAKSPDLSQQWHPTRNGKRTPADFVSGSHKKVWWKCPVADDHEWPAAINTRTRLNTGCPMCRKLVPSKTNCLSTLFPEIAAEWHPKLNGKLTPENVVAGSDKEAWWQCSVSSDHVWQTRVANRTSRSKTGCPQCRGLKPSITNSLASLFPEIANEWHPLKNAPFTPDDVVAGSEKKFWWKCPNGFDHEWESNIANRTRLGRGCPRCNKGWTVAGVRSFVESIRPHLEHFTPAELFLLFQQSGLLDGARKTKSFLKALTTGKFPIDEVDKFIDGKPSVVDDFLAEPDKTLDDIESDDPIIDVDNQGRSISDDPSSAAFEPLPEVTVTAALSALDSHVVTSADEEAVEFLVSAAVSKLWKVAYKDATDAIAHVEKFDGGKYAEKAKARFLSEIKHAQSLKTPKGYSFVVAGRKVEPNLMQRHFASRVMTQKRVGNWSGTGAGKTLSAIYASRLADAKFSVVCCPNSVVSGWVNAVVAIFPDSDVCSKTWRPKWRAKSKHRYLVMNYESFQQADSAANIAELTEKQKIDFLIVDEIHYTKQRTVENLSLRRQMVTALASLASQKNEDLHVLGMSATPVINNLHEGRSLIDLVTGVEHDELETSKVSVANCMRMHQRLVTLGIRWMPDYKIGFEQIEVPLDCSAVMDDIRALGRSGSTLELEKILTKVRLPVILKNIQPKTLIYTHYVQGIDKLLYDAISDAGWKVGFYTGEDKAGKDAFIDGDVDVLIGSSAIGTGVDGLQTVCNRLIVNVLPWTAAEFEQLKGRIFRQGQVSDKVTVVIPITSAEVSGQHWSWCRSKMNRLDFKKSVADAVVDGVVPEGHLRSPAQAYQDLMKWMERLDAGDIQTVARKPIIVSATDLGVKETKRRIRTFGDFSTMNNRWNNSKSAETGARLAKDPTEWEEYHRLYREARMSWPVVPYAEFVRWANDRDGYSIGDFGCGEALVAKALSHKHTVHSFDHIAVNDDVVACDIAHVPIEDESLDVALFSLSLMGSNFSDYLREAHRTLKLDGQLHLWEASSRFTDLEGFVKGLCTIGFDLLRQEVGKFTLLQLIKSKAKSTPDIKLKM